jgi:hypothetical protein
MTLIDTRPHRLTEAPLAPRPGHTDAPRAGSRSAGPRFRGSAAMWRWARWVAVAVGGFLLPWCAVLAVTLPHTAQAQNWSLAWVGLDAAEATAALATAFLLARADARASLTAMATGVLLTIDAWFDVCTSASGLDHALALAEAGFLELPLAAAAFWLAHTLIRRGHAGSVVRYGGRPKRGHDFGRGTTSPAGSGGGSTGGSSGSGS